MSSEDRDNNGRFKEKNLYAHVYSERQGRPRIYTDAQDLIEKGFEYFDWCEWARKGKLTYAGLKLYLGLADSTYKDYRKHPDFSAAITYLEQTLEDFNEIKLQWAGSTQGAIFSLKNKAGWKDENTVNQNVTEYKTKWAEPENDKPQ